MGQLRTMGTYSLFLMTTALFVFGQSTMIYDYNPVQTSSTRDDTMHKPRSARHIVGLNSLPNSGVGVWSEPIFASPSVLNFKHQSATKNSLDYHDPLLITGPKRKQSVGYLYSNELFFGDIPHVKALLLNLEHRRQNGLYSKRLGSLRIESPWYRYKKDSLAGIDKYV